MARCAAGANVNCRRLTRVANAFKNPAAARAAAARRLREIKVKIPCRNHRNVEAVNISRAAEIRPAENGEDRHLPYSRSANYRPAKLLPGMSGWVRRAMRPPSLRCSGASEGRNQRGRQKFDCLWKRRIEVSAIGQRERVTCPWWAGAAREPYASSSNSQPNA